MRLTPRNYSISSSPLVSPHEVQLTVSVVRYRGADGGQRGGVCSTFLADRAAAAPVFLQRSPHFRPPEDGETPMIMVGPGHRHRAVPRLPAGTARARPHAAATGCSSAIGTAAENFYYRDDLEDMARDGLLNRLDLAFSRDQADRVYVQHKMLDYGADVWRWLDDGGHFYVCGDASQDGQGRGRRAHRDHSTSTGRCPKRAPTTTSVSWSRPSATSATCTSSIRCRSAVLRPGRDRHRWRIGHRWRHQPSAGGGRGARGARRHRRRRRLRPDPRPDHCGRRNRRRSSSAHPRARHGHLGNAKPRWPSDDSRIDHCW